MKLWHKIVLAPAVAIVCLVGLGAAAYTVLQQQNETLIELFDTRFGNYRLAAGGSQEIGEVHSSVYRLFTWIGNLKEDKIKQITGEQLAKIDRVSARLAEFGARCLFGIAQPCGQPTIADIRGTVPLHHAAT